MSQMTLEFAEAAVRGARAKAAELGVSATVTVVDAAGRLILSSRADGTGFFTTDTSRAKAVASAGFRVRTADIDLDSHGGFFAAVPSLLPGQILTSPGGTPIVRDGVIIGAIGIGGAPAELDQVCADAGAAALFT